MTTTSLATTPVAADLMVHVTDLCTFAPDADIMDVIQHILKKKISEAIVLDPEAHFVGIVSEKCALHAMVNALREGLPFERIDDAYEKDPPTARPTTDLLTVAHQFASSDACIIPVLDDEGRVLGGVQRRKLLDRMTRALNSVGKPDIQDLYLSATRDRSQKPT